MNIFSFDYPPSNGGIARLCGELARHLQKRGLLSGVITREYSSNRNPIYPNTTDCNPGRPRRELEAYNTLRRQSSTGVIAGIWYPEGLVARAARSRPLIILAHGLELIDPDTFFRKKIWAQVRKWVLGNADLVVANSHYTAALVKQVAPKATIAVNPLAVDHHRFRPKESDYLQRMNIPARKIISTVSRIDSFKGHETVLKALAALPHEVRRQLLYLIAGKGSYLDQLKEKVEQFNIENSVHFLGFVPEDELPDLYCATDLFVMCTRTERMRQNVEGFGLVFLEAQACGTPVVGTRMGGIPDAIEEGNGGWMIEENDVSALSYILKSLIDTPEDFYHEGLKARKRVEEDFTWDHYVNRLLEIFNAKSIDL